MKFDNKVVQHYREYSEMCRGIFPLSTNVDILLFLLGEKQNLRTQVIDNQKIFQFEWWCKNTVSYFEMDDENFLYLASNEKNLKRLVSIDHSFDPHERELGYLLGYPACCCEKIAEVGEMEIDEFEISISQQNFSDVFRLINPCAYRKGKSFISHVPCSTDCMESLKQALIVANFVLSNKNESMFHPWLEELQVMI